MCRRLFFNKTKDKSHKTKGKKKTKDKSHKTKGLRKDKRQERALKICPVGKFSEEPDCRGGQDKRVKKRQKI